MRSSSLLALMVIATLATSCKNPQAAAPESTTLDTNAVAIESALPAATLQKLRAMLPKSAAPKLQAVLDSQQTFWYDHDSMKPAYQDSMPDLTGANVNSEWIDAFAPANTPTGRNIYNRAKRRWAFPFGATAGTDNADNMKVYNFLWLPTKDGKILPVSIYNDSRVVSASDRTRGWGWKYPIGAVVGELICVVMPSGEVVPVEIRTRVRYADGWATNAFRPFPTARSLSEAIKAKRPDWQSNEKLRTMVAHLENDGNLVAKTLESTNIPGAFKAVGALDELPDFGDEALVKDLLKQTPFESTYGLAWKSDGSKKTFAASSKFGGSIVPRNYEGGLIPVHEESCQRCHAHTGKILVHITPAFDKGDGSSAYLYGELWGRDGIFSFHPFDESKFRSLTVPSDNKAVNPRLRQAGIVTFGNSAPGAPNYPNQEILGTRNYLKPSDGTASDGPSGTPGAGGSSGSGSSGSGSSGSGSSGSGSSGSGSDASTSSVVEFRIPSGTGSGDWNRQSNPVLARPGQTVRIINDDTTAHQLHANNGEPCPHQYPAMGRGGKYDCAIPASAKPGTVYMLWDHNLGGPSSGRFWIKVQ